MTNAIVIRELDISVEKLLLRKEKKNQTNTSYDELKL